MERTLITELPDGRFSCTVTLNAEELPEFLRSVQRQGSATQSGAKPPAQIMAVNGFEAFGPMRSCEGLDVRVLANHAPFQRFVESNVALDESSDSVQHALAFINGERDIVGLIARYRAWHAQRWPGEQALPGEGA